MPARRIVVALLMLLSLPTFAAAKTIVWTCPVPIYLRASVDLRETLPANVHIVEHRYSRQNGKYAPAAASPASRQTISIGD